MNLAKSPNFFIKDVIDNKQSYFTLNHVIFINFM